MLDSPGSMIVFKTLVILILLASCSTSGSSFPQNKQGDHIEKLIYDNSPTVVYVEAKFKDQCNGVILYLPLPIREELESLYESDPRAGTVFTSWGGNTLALIAAPELGKRDYPLWLLLENGFVMELNIRLAEKGQRPAKRIRIVMPTEKTKS